MPVEQRNGCIILDRIAQRAFFTFSCTDGEELQNVSYSIPAMIFSGDIGGGINNLQ